MNQMTMTTVYRSNNYYMQAVIYNACDERPPVKGGKRMKYDDFLKHKEITTKSVGFNIDKSELNKNAFEWQKDIVRWALKKGKAALFEDCGLGKTLQQLMWSEQVSNHTGKPVLILSPLAVTKQTESEAIKFGITAKVVRDNSQIENLPNITNYEIVEHFDMSQFGGIVLDESSILKDYTSKTKQLLIDLCKDIPFKLCCTATPSPNDFVELGNHAEFLGIMTRAEMLATFFVHDGGSTADWRLKGHAVEKFFSWVASWACCMTSPADLGYDGTLYKLPQLNIIEHCVKGAELEDADGQMLLLPQQVQSLSERRNARRISIEGRANMATDIANKYDGQVLIWCDLNDESTMLAKQINGAVEVKGADTPEHKVNSMNGFTSGDIRCLVSKPKIAGWGMNWQNCSEIIFVGLSDSFEAFYQAVRRCWRFGQKNNVNVHIILSDAEQAVKSNIERKQADCEKMTKELVKFTKDILQKDIKQTTRMTESYIATEKMIVPDWIRSEVA